MTTVDESEVGIASGRRAGASRLPRGPAKRRRGSRGFATIWVVLCAVLLIALAGLVCDASYVVLAENQLQNAADAAALAAAQLVTSDPAGARAQAINTAAANTAAGAAAALSDNPSNSPDGEIVIGQYNRSTGVFTPTLSSPNAVKVVVNRTKSSHGAATLTFGPIFGRDTIDLSRWAIAVAQFGSGSATGLLLLNPHAPGALTMSGSGTVAVTGGSVAVDSDNLNAFILNGSETVASPGMSIVGGYSITGGGSIQGGLQAGASVVADPLASLAPPTVTNDLGAVKLTGSSSATLNPGYYSGGISVTDNASVTLKPGIYKLGGAGLQVALNGSLSAAGAMIYVADTGSVSLTGTGAVSISPPNTDNYSYPGASTYQGIAIFQDRADARAGTLAGNGNINISGTIYMPSAALTLSGHEDALGSAVVADSANLSGSISIGGEAKLPSPKSVFLVQ